MTKIEEIDALASLRRKEIAALIEEKETLPARIAAASEKAASAASAGDYDAYTSAARERDDLKNKVEFLDMRLKKLRELPEVDPKVVREAWENYRSTYDPKLEKKISAFEAARQKALDLYGELVDMQTDAATIRCRFAQITGVPVTEACRQFPAKSIPLKTATLDSSGYGVLKMGGTNIVDPDAARFLSNYITRKSEADPAYNYIHDMDLAKLNGVLGAGIISV